MPVIPDSLFLRLEGGLVRSMAFNLWSILYMWSSLSSGYSSLSVLVEVSQFFDGTIKS